MPAVNALPLRGLWTVMLTAALLALLGLVFLWYRQPRFLLTLSDLWWGCV